MSESLLSVRGAKPSGLCSVVSIVSSLVLVKQYFSTGKACAHLQTRWLCFVHLSGRISAEVLPLTLIQSQGVVFYYFIIKWQLFMNPSETSNISGIYVTAHRYRRSIRRERTGRKRRGERGRKR